MSGALEAEETQRPIEDSRRPLELDAGAARAAVRRAGEARPEGGRGMDPVAVYVRPG
jgi:hypothetical protein